MNILMVNMSLDPVTGGGTVERTVQLARHFVLAGAGCSILTTDFGLTVDRANDLAKWGIRVAALHCRVKRFYLPDLDMRRVNRLVREADIVHLMNHWTIINVMVYAACLQQKKPYLVCPAGALPVFGRSAFLKRAFNQLIGKRIIKSASGHIAIPFDEIDQFRPYGVAPEKITVIPNGIDPADFTARGSSAFRKKYTLSDVPFILFVGRLNPIKGPDLLLKAFVEVKNKIPDLHLVFAGPDGGLQSELMQMTSGWKLQDKVHFLGYIGGADKSRAYHAAELLVIPSRQEAMSIVALEAGIAGTPVLLTDQCGFDQVEAVGGGRVVSPTPESIGAGLLSLCADSKRSESLGRMGARLQKHISQHLTWTSVVQKYLELFETIAAGSGAR